MREKLQLLSRISGNRTIGFHRSKKKSSSMRQELHVGTRIQVFSKLREVGGFLLLGLILVQESFKWLRYLGPKNLGLNVKFFGLFSDSPRFDFRSCFQAFWN